MSDVANNAHAWLSQQIEELGALRNASTRDPQFKQWRQNTLTFIQRIWPDDQQRSERFRRIPFSPPSSKHDVKTARDFYERGCAEAIEYLQALLQSIDEHGISAPMPAETAEDTTPDGSEDDFPLVELSSENESESEPELEPESEPEPEMDLGPELELEPEPQAPPPPSRSEQVGPPPVPGRRGARPGPPPARPAPPPARPAQAQRPPQRPAAPNTLPVSEVAIPPVPTRAGTGRSASGPPRISVKGDTGSKRGDRDGQKNPLENILSSVDPERPAEAPPKSGKKGGKKNGNKQRLKDMLGFAELESRSQAEPDDPAPPRAPSAGSARPATPQRPQKPAARGPRREDAGRMPMPEFMLPEESDGPESSAREEYGPSELERTPPPRPGGLKRQPDLAGERGPFDDEPAEEMPQRGMIDADDVDRLEFEEPAAEEEFEEEPPEEEAMPDEEEPREDTSAAAAEFVMNSPVLSSQARPVQRGKPPSLNPLHAQTPAAAALLSLAAEVNTIGIPEGNRAWARAALVDLARQIESGQLSWEALRDAVHFLMEFPPLARRVLPLLLPFFERAA